MGDEIHEWAHDGRVTTFRWLGASTVAPDRVYAIAFTKDRHVLLVADARTSPSFWLPGGGVEKGESAETALARELLEEANASIKVLGLIGAQRADDPVDGTSYQSFYWCRIALADRFDPVHEVTERRLVRSDEFLDTLFRGSSDPKAAMLLERAMELDDAYDRQQDAVQFATERDER